MAEMGCVYQAKCKATGKCYIGKTVYTMEHRRSRHFQELRDGSTLLFHRALGKYGIEGFEWTVLFQSDNDSQLLEMEIEFIRLLNTKKPHGYNLTDGGEGTAGLKRGPLPAEVIAKMAASRTGKKRSAETRLKMSLAQKGRKTAPLTAETKAKISAALKGRPTSENARQVLIRRNRERPAAKGKKFTQEHKDKIGAAHKGKKRGPLSAEWRANLSASHIGGKRTAETKRKMSESAKRRWARRKTPA